MNSETPVTPQTLLEQADRHHRQGRLDKALADFDKALAIEPGNPAALVGRANMLMLLNRAAEALASYDQALAIQPNHQDALNNRAIALHRLGRRAEALASLRRLLRLRPDNINAASYYGELLLETGQGAEALPLFDKIIAALPASPQAHLGRGRALKLLNRLSDAIHSCDRAVMLKPDFVEAYFHRGMILAELGHRRDAIANYEQAIALQPDAIGPINNRAAELLTSNRFAEAEQAYLRLNELRPGTALSLNGLAACAARACSWDRSETYLEGLRREVMKGNPDIQVGALLNYHDEPALQLACARNYPLGPGIAAGEVLWRGPRFSAKRIRLAYCSADFQSHPMPRLLARMFEDHDRERFEVIAISFSVDDGSPMRARLTKAFDEFHDVLRFSERAIAEKIGELKIDIAVDLMGFTSRARPAVFAMRPAPVQVNYMGYPSTLAAAHWDYAIGDPITLPMTLQPFYAEKIVQLPDTYMATDDTKPLPGPSPARTEAGLPETGFVFCCFNNNWKITAPIFDIWTRLLKAVPDSVLWLLKDNDEVMDNLRRHAAERGIDPKRLIFAPRVEQDEHMARLALGDLFLDTLPYNAHTTAVDSLWAAVPLVTCLGQSFYSRVAGSVLHAAGLPELITENLADYERLALDLARDPARLAGLRQKLERGRGREPLFDSARFTRNMERAYITMGEIWRKGEGPKPFAVPST